MALEFSGPATPMTDSDIERAAAEIGCAVAAVRAVVEVESKSGFLPDTRPVILFERHYFSRLTGGKYDASNPGISNPSWGGYGTSASQYDRLADAIKLDRKAALKSASWGAFQIMGENHKAAGYDDVESFVAAMVKSEAAHLDAFVKFVKKKGLADELVRRDWAGFARGYNGAQYAANKYDTKLEAAWVLHSLGGPRTTSPLPVLRMGDKGKDVVTLQTALGVTADGDFGPGTKKAVIKLQKGKKLYQDGIVGKQVWAALGL